MMWPAVAFGFVATEVTADCAQGLIPFSSCDIVGQDTSLDVCHDDFTATYRYGRRGEIPELYLSEPIETVNYRPWDGHALVGSITFYNGDYAYEVVSGFNSEFSDEGLSHYGWITVLHAGAPLTRFECVLEKVDGVYGSDIYDLKVAAGLTWYGAERGWLPTPDPN
ncbi:hypothetical protein [Sulfitobacter sp.]|jgi:hypothetical protein|uniref:hypothetical protein n=1 Tax=Sulfitobacter sp. TaxID=1903071 RepID=UPI0039E6C368